MGKDFLSQFVLIQAQLVHHLSRFDLRSYQVVFTDENQGVVRQGLLRFATRKQNEKKIRILLADMSVI